MNSRQKAVFLHRISQQNNSYRYRLPCRHETGRFVHNLLDFLFPLSQDCPDFDNEANQSLRFDEIQAQLDRLLLPLEDKLPITRKRVVEDFFTQLPDIFELFLLDAKAITENDPASVGIEEVIAVYPGFMAICSYRIAHLLAKCEVPLLPRMITEYAHGATGIDIHPNAIIGHSFFIDHGTGVVIGETAHIGNHVMIYQGVTLGATHVAKS